MLQFYTGRSPNSIKIEIILAELEAPAQRIFVDIDRGEQMRGSYLAINPNHKIPAIVDGDVAVWESGAIAQYLAEIHGKLLPKAGAARGQVLSLVNFEAAGLSPNIGGYGLAGLFGSGQAQARPARVNELTEELHRVVSVYERVLSDDRPYLGGEFSIADPQSFIGLSKGAQMKLFEPGEKLVAWIERVARRPGVQRGLAQYEAFLAEHTGGEE